MDIYEYMESLRRDEWRGAKRNDPSVRNMSGKGGDHHIYTMTDENWEQLGWDIANNTHLAELALCSDALNDHKMSFLFRGLTRSNTLNSMQLDSNALSVVGVRSMVPFLQNANNLTYLNLDNNNLQTEGFNKLLSALRDSPIKRLRCSRCGIDSIEIESASFPKHLMHLNLNSNNIDIEGCRRLAALLQGDTSLKELNLGKNQLDNDGVAILINALQKNKSLTTLDLSNNKIRDDQIAALAAVLQSNATLIALKLQENKITDEGAEILADALKSNTSLVELDLSKNAISKRGFVSFLKLVNDISSIKATLQSNHTLEELKLSDDEEIEDEILILIDNATFINMNESSPEAAGRAKIILEQLDSVTRAKLADLQGVTHSVYSEIDSLYLPEVLSLISKNNGRKELFPALKSSMVGLLSRVDMKVCIRQQVAKYEASIQEQVALHEASIQEQVALHEARIRVHEEMIRAMISEHESMISKHVANIEKLNNRLAAMEGRGQDDMNQGIKQQNVKRRRVDG